MNKDLLLGLITDISGIQCVWAAKRQPFIQTRAGKQALGVLTVRSFSTIGTDEIIEIYDVTQNRNLTSQCGTRAFTLSIRIDAFGSCDAWEIAQRIATRIRRPSSRQKLRDAEISLAETLSSVDTTFTIDQSERTSSTIDFRMNAIVNDDLSGPDGEDGNYISTVLPAGQTGPYGDTDITGTVVS